MRNLRTHAKLTPLKTSETQHPPVYVSTKQPFLSAAVLLVALWGLAPDRGFSADEDEFELAEETGRIFIHPYDDPDVITGQATIALEMFRQNHTPIDYLFICIGGGGLAAGMAHEINNPITGIINYAQIIDDCWDQKGTKHGQLPGWIIQEGERIAGIVSKLLSFARSICRQQGVYPDFGKVDR